MGLPPSEAGAVHETVERALPAVAATAEGAAGAVTTGAGGTGTGAGGTGTGTGAGGTGAGTGAGGTGATGVTLLEASEAGLLPIALVATTVNVYAVPLVRPVTVALVAGAVTMAEPPAGEDVTV